MPKPRKTIGANPLDRLDVKGKGRDKRAVVSEGAAELRDALLKGTPAKGKPARRKKAKPAGAWGWVKSLIGG